MGFPVKTCCVPTLRMTRGMLRTRLASCQDSRNPEVTGASGADEF